MIESARLKMPKAKLYQGDFSNVLVEELKQNKYDAIIATYSLHHLTNEQKVCFLKSLQSLLNDGGCIYIGDVAFKTRIDMENYRVVIGDEWDDEEIYFAVDELAKSFPQVKFEPFSFCSGVLSLEK